MVWKVDSVSELLVKLPKFRRGPFPWFCTASGEGEVETSSETLVTLENSEKLLKSWGPMKTFR